MTKIQVNSQGKAYLTSGGKALEANGGSAATIWARNDLGASYTVTAGDKVWVCEISTSMSQQYVWNSTAQFSQYTSLFLTPYTGYETILRAQTSSNSNRLYVFDDDAETLTLVEGTAASGIHAIYYSPSVVGYRTTQTGTGTKISVQTATGTLLDDKNKKTSYLHHGWSIYETNLYKWNMNTGVIDTGTIYGTFATAPNTSSTGTFFQYMNVAGTAFFENVSGGSTYCVYLPDANNVYTKQTAVNVPSSINLNLYSVLGATSDEKYLILGYCYTNYYTSSSPARIFELTSDRTELKSLYTDLDITGAVSFYPEMQILIANNAGTIKMWKYDTTNGFVQQNIDFGSVTFTQTKPVTLNYDASMMCVNDDTAGVYLFSLVAAAPNTYKAVPFSHLNFNSNYYTGILTGEVSGNNVEVEAVVE